MDGLNFDSDDLVDCCSSGMVSPSPISSPDCRSRKGAPMRLLNQRTRHRLLQALFWNRFGAKIVPKLIRYEQMFDVVVRGYSLIGQTNGERWLLTLLGDKPVVFDVGFHDGASTAEVLRARPLGRVVAFDPSQFALRCYESKFSADERVTFESIGLSNLPGELAFYDYDNMCNSLVPRKESLELPTVYRVPVATLDNYCGDHDIEHIDFLKIDAEGFDLHVLEGAKEVLSRQVVDIFAFEFASGWCASKRYLWEAAEYVADVPYTLFHLYNGFLCPLVYDIRIDSACTLSAMYVGISDKRLASGGIPVRNYLF